MVAIFKVAKGEKLIQHTPALSKVVLASLSSPLASGHCRQLWGVLCHSVFKQWTLGKKDLIQSMYRILLCTIVLKFFSFFFGGGGGGRGGGPIGLGLINQPF